MVFAVIGLLLAFVFSFIHTQMHLINMIANDKMAQFVLVNSILLLVVGIFFIIFHDRLKLYLKNYRREKKI